MLLRRARLAAILVAAVALTASSCGPAAPAPDGQAPGVPPLTGSVSVGVANDLPGFAQRVNYNFSGFDIDLVRWLGQNTPGVQFTPVPIDTAVKDREAVLLQGQRRLVVEVYSITDQKQKIIDFAGPYMITQQGVLARAGDKRITNVDSLRKKTICAPEGSTSVDQLPRYLQDDINLIQEEAVSSCVTALINQQADVVSTDQLVLAGFAAKDSRVAVVPELKFGAQERYGIGMPNGDKSTCEQLRMALSQFIASGAWDQFFAANFKNISPGPYKPDPYNLNQCQ